MKYGKLTLGQIEALMNKLGGEKGALAFLRGDLEVVGKDVEIIIKKFMMVVNYDLSIKELLKSYASKRYAGADAEKNEEIYYTECLPTEKGKREVEFALFQFNAGATSKEVIDRMEESGYRPATVRELLSFGNKTLILPNEQILALGLTVVSNGFRNQRICKLMNVYEEEESHRDVHLSYNHNEQWGSLCSFLAVRK